MGEALEVSLVCWESHEADVFLNYLNNVVQMVAITMTQMIKICTRIKRSVQEPHRCVLSRPEFI